MLLAYVNHSSQGISQCLITVRLCLVDGKLSSAPTTSRLAQTVSSSDQVKSPEGSGSRTSAPDVILLSPTKVALADDRASEKTDMTSNTGQVDGGIFMTESV